ncbi:hypothetical protein B0A49_05061 [Cryomyces minteri]|uniref:C2H2-type domain-containing protein n=1 Tax=Cryomyces minteri TaxID=331657 RepID=A0A4U0X0L3_9PEZI|nr:hypothetical protein B0A49_07007 [Cryomyces minteri]TKA72859.1 hypothetical protein B0A49_05061 [Cryomyces minteri]
MASYAEYPTTQAHDNNNNDFILYPRQHSVWEYPGTSQTYNPISSYPEPSFGSSGALFDYSFLQAFSSLPRSQDLAGSIQATQQGLKHNLYPHGFTASPAHSAVHSFDANPPVLSSNSDSGASVQSTSSSAMGSPSMNPGHPLVWATNHGLGIIPTIVQPETSGYDVMATNSFNFESIRANDKSSSCVDPHLINTYSPTPYTAAPYTELSVAQSPQSLVFANPPSPSLSQTSVHSVQQQRAPSRAMRKSGSQSPYLRTASWAPYPINATPMPRRPSISSRVSQSSFSDGDSAAKGLCPMPDCGRSFKDLKAHMLTHQPSRPEKCPIGTCEYHLKGFARKYDKNRHTLTHYKGTMVCGFCPGSGSSAEKSFNRADVFKRHLASVHGVDQTAPNSRKRSPTAKPRYGGIEDVRGTCSTCSVTFANAQEFYDHLDECVLRVVQQIEPSEDINQKLLSSVAEDNNVRETMNKHRLSNSIDYTIQSYDEENDFEDDEDDAAAIDDSNDETKSKAGSTNGKNNASDTSRVGLTFSRGGVALSNAAISSRKKRKNYPLAWGCAPEKMKMKKRVLCVYDGPRRLWKDDMMLDSDFEVRMKLPDGDGKSWVTDLDVQTLARAKALHNATDTERGPWIEDGQLRELWDDLDPSTS